MDKLSKFVVGNSGNAITITPPSMLCPTNVLVPPPSKFLFHIRQSPNQLIWIVHHDNDLSLLSKYEQKNPSSFSKRAYRMKNVSLHLRGPFPLARIGLSWNCV